MIELEDFPIRIRRHDKWKYRIEVHFTEQAERYGWAAVSIIAFLLGWSLP
jgi:hypothetical protein